MISFNYPNNPTQENKRNYKQFITSMKNTLPCKYCRLNLAAYLKRVPISATVLKSRESFSRYVYDLHEYVNKVLRKKSNLKYSDVRKRYEHFRSTCDISGTVEAAKDNTNNKNNKKESGCTMSLYGKKSRCVIKIVPTGSKGESFQMDDRCLRQT